MDEIDRKLRSRRCSEAVGMNVSRPECKVNSPMGGALASSSASRRGIKPEKSPDRTCIFPGGSRPVVSPRTLSRTVVKTTSDLPPNIEAATTPHSQGHNI